MIYRVNKHIIDLFKKKQVRLKKQYIYEYKQLLSYMISLRFLLLNKIFKNNVYFKLRIPLFAISSNRLNFFVITDSYPIKNNIHKLSDKQILKLVKSIFQIYINT